MRAREAGYLRRRLIDHAELKSELGMLKLAFDARYGARFTNALAALETAATAPAPAVVA